MNKSEVLAKFLGVDADEINESKYSDDTFEAGSAEYMVLTDEEADEKCFESIKESVWTFRPEFLASHMVDGIDVDVIKILQEKCEDANKPLLKMLKDVNDFMSDAVASDGRGHFLSSYDGEENEINIDGEWFYIYRTN